MNDSRYETVRFRNSILICPIINGEPHVVLKNIIDDIGLTQVSVSRGIKNHPRLANYLTVWSGKLDNFQGYEYLTLPITRVAAWLYSININKVKASARKALEEYQDKCDYVLYDHFFGAKGELRDHISQASQYDKRMRKIKRLTTILNAEFKRLAQLKRLEDQTIFKAANPEIDFGSKTA